MRSSAAPVSNGRTEVAHIAADGIPLAGGAACRPVHDDPLRLHAALLRSVCRQCLVARVRLVARMPLADRVDRCIAALLPLALLCVGLHQPATLLLVWARPGARMDPAAPWRVPTKTRAMRACFGLVRRRALLWAAR
ncbi:hypothetical protein K8O61_18980 [Xanthomonas cerealis pv. cerealis]|uniref:hypothetical protein n=1 Tax=Xanthomonas cerealis TaxID=3390025 RepID=UPI001F44A673|nr:hypothetical protein [Xanthomonas translucens]UKE69477.1 hypothetical protein K8O61_18980 [Xanthomonas translucens pv. pistacia]